LSQGFLPTVPVISPSLLGLFLGVPLLATAGNRPYTVIVPLHNKESTIEATIKSILEQTRKPRDVIVVNDASTDSSRDVIERLSKEITILDNEVNIGKARSINEALELVKTPYVLIVDADTVLAPDFAEQLLRGFVDEKVAGVSGVVLPTSIKTRTEHARLIEYLLGTSHKKTQTRLKGIWTLAGCAMMWRTDVLRKIGGVPTDTIVEDMDLSWKAQATRNEEEEKYVLTYSPRAIAYTDEPKTFHDYLKQLDRWFSISRVIKKNLRDIKWGLKITFAWSMLEAILPFVFIATVGYFLLIGEYSWSGIILAMDAGILLLVSTYLGLKYKIKLSKVLKGVGWFWLYRFVNAVKFWQRIIVPKKKWY